MAYADEGFYENDYYGNAVPGDLLYRYLEAASDRIDNITYNRLEDGLPENERAQIRIKKAVCAIADALYQIDTFRNNSMETVETIKREDGTVTGKMVSSVSSGSESITYITGVTGSSTDVYTQAAMDKKVENMLLRQIATEYLCGVTDKKGEYLLYAGM